MSTERLERGPIPVQEAIGIAKQVAEALEEAHEKCIVHRDLKPANVKITPDGKVILGTAARGRPVDKRAYPTQDHARPLLADPLVPRDLGPAHAAESRALGRRRQTRSAGRPGT
jgi:serine/threonine protein kinase